MPPFRLPLVYNEKKAVVLFTAVALPFLSRGVACSLSLRDRIMGVFGRN